MAKYKKTKDFPMKRRKTPDSVSKKRQVLGRKLRIWAEKLADPALAPKQKAFCEAEAKKCRTAILKLINLGKPRFWVQ